MAIYNYQAVTISSGQTVSGAIDLQGHTICGLIMPAAFTSASLTFSMSQTVGGTYAVINKDGSDLSKTVAASKYIVLSPSEFAGINFLKLISGSAEAANRQVIVVSRPVQ